MNDSSIGLTITPTGSERLCLASITPGITLEFDQETITSCTVCLRSNLSPQNPTWEVSEIELRAYYPDDISEAVGNLNDDVPIWYYSGYPGDYSEVRNFYLSEAADQTNNILTLKGQDSSYKLEGSTVAAHLSQAADNVSRAKIYNEFKNIITGAGIKPVSTESAPGAVGSNTTTQLAVYRESSAREYVAYIMNLARIDGFHPTFVDAGIPTIRWTPETSKWDIYEEDCGDVSRVVDRNIAKLVSDEDGYGVYNTVSKETTWTTLQSGVEVTAGQRVTQNFDQWYWNYSVSNESKRIWTTIQSIQFLAKKTSYTKNNKKYNYCTTKGKRIPMTKGPDSYQPSDKRPGITLKVKHLIAGIIRSNGVQIFPLFRKILDRSNISGSFKFKGDPRMQPRDVFTFHRLDGTTETCTIEEITLTHEDGGTSAELKYRKGVC